MLVCMLLMAVAFFGYEYARYYFYLRELYEEYFGPEQTIVFNLERRTWTDVINIDIEAEPDTRRARPNSPRSAPYCSVDNPCEVVQQRQRNLKTKDDLYQTVIPQVTRYD